MNIPTKTLTRNHGFQSPENGILCALCGEGLEHANHAETQAPAFEARYEKLIRLGLDDSSAYRDAMPENFARAALGAVVYFTAGICERTKCSTGGDGNAMLSAIGADLREVLAMVQAHEKALILAKL